MRGPFRAPLTWLMAFSLSSYKQSDTSSECTGGGGNGEYCKNKSRQAGRQQQAKWLHVSKRQILDGGGGRSRGN